MSHPNNHRFVVMDVYKAALDAVNGESCVHRYLDRHPMSGEVFVIAIGKAALSMARGAVGVLDRQIRAGLVVTKTGYGAAIDERFEVLESSHPLPDGRSLRAGKQLLAFIQEIPPGAEVLFLISGGASALVEVLPEGVSIESWQAMSQWLLSHDLDITMINAVRKRCSCIKGGRLTRYFADHRVTCLAISDVPDDNPAVIGSGLLAADPALQWPLAPDFAAMPDEIDAMLQTAPSAPVPGDACFSNVQYRIIANLDMAREAAAREAAARGYHVVLHPEFVSGNAIEQGQRIASTLMQGPKGVHVWGGETTLDLPSRPGRGGRCQSLALSAALALQGHDDMTLLAAGTDGSDGPGADAGAVIDGGTVRRGEAVLGRLAANYLQRADAGSFLQASDDLFQTGPTGTNVMDLIIGIRHSTTL